LVIAVKQILHFETARSGWYLRRSTLEN